MAPKQSCLLDFTAEAHLMTTIGRDSINLNHHLPTRWQILWCQEFLSYPS